MKVKPVLSAVSVYKAMRDDAKPQNGKKKQKSEASGDQNNINKSEGEKKPANKDKMKKAEDKLGGVMDKSKAIKKKSAAKSLVDKIVGTVMPKQNKAKAASTSMPKDLIGEDDGEHYSQQQKLIDTHLEQRLPSYMFDSREHGKRALKWLLYPTNLDTFFTDIWEQKPLLVKRDNRNYFKGLFSCKEFDDILRNGNLLFGKNIDITSYVNDKRETHNGDGRAYAAVVWDQFNAGRSIRFLNPQTYSRSVWKLLSILQEFFSSFVGSNVYLTPRGTQGFAPHFDDIEAFVVQLEGKKKWKVYKPLSPEQTLPNYSSKNFKRNELDGHPPLIEVVLEPGDVLYFPRGWIHEAEAADDIHSLHITISTYQRNTFGDLIEKILPQALRSAVDNDVSFRRSLPHDYLSFMGIVNQDMNNEKRDEFLRCVRELLVDKLINYVQVDSAVDQMGKQFIHDSLPPVLTEIEKQDSIHGGGEVWNSKTNEVENAIEIEPDTAIKLLRYNIVRLVMEEDTVRLYHSVENSREYHGFEPQYIDVGAQYAPAVDFLSNSYPEYVTVDELPLENLDDKLEIANLLYDKGLITIVDPDQDQYSCDITSDSDSQDHDSDSSASD